MLNVIPSVQRLHATLASQGIPIEGVSSGAPGAGGGFTVAYAPEASEAQKAQGDAIAATFDPRPYQSRQLHVIYADINALTPTQKTNIWNDLMSGSPPKLATDGGSNEGSIFLVWRLVNNASLPAAMINDMKATAISYYVQDIPYYLVNPSFDPSIDVPGSSPIG